MENLKENEDEENKGEVENVKREIREIMNKYGKLNYISKQIKF